MPTTVSNSVDTVNAAAAAIVTAESRVQPVSSQKRRWGSCWHLYWCFGSLKTNNNNKRISHAALVPDPDVPEGSVPIPDNPNQSTSVVFVAPPSSPLPESDPPTGTHSPVGFLAVGPLNTMSSSAGEAHIFTIGPYAHETQPVSPPVFSAFTTEPSTAAVTPPPEPMFTTPSSPEVPFAQLLTSSLHRARRNSGSSGHKFALSCYELHHHHLISPGSANSVSGTSSPYLDKRPVLEFRMIDASKLFESKKIYTRKWGSRLGSGSITPDGTGLASPTDKTPMAQRVSFELISHQDSRKCGEMKIKETPLEVAEECKLCSSSETNETGSGETEQCRHKRTSFSLGSVKEFNFDSTDQETPAKSIAGSDWWADETVVRDIEAEENWSFYPLLQPGVS